jgi:hypothetical protein
MSPTKQQSQARYRKGKETAFSPKNASRQIADGHGVLVKHQDGSHVTQETLDYVAGTIDVFQGCLYDQGIEVDLPKLFGGRLTVVHTLGKHPFMTQFSGVFCTHSGSGWNPSISVGNEHCEAGIHELAHALDHFSGKISASLSHDSVTRMVASCNVCGTDQFIRLIDLVGPETARRYMSKIEGPYWRRPSEQFARAWEQLVSAYCEVSGRDPVGVVRYDKLRREKAQWDADPGCLDVLDPVLGLFQQRHPMVEIATFRGLRETAASQLTSKGVEELTNA